MGEILLELNYKYDNEEEAKEAAAFLEYSECKGWKLEFDEESGLYSILISESKLQVADKLIEIYESEKTQTLFNQADEEQKVVSKSAKPYIEPKERFADMHSSAASFLLIGVLGLTILVLGITEIISIPLISGGFSFSNCIMILVFIIFIIIGLYSLKSAKEIKGNISKEENFIKEVNEWFISCYAKDLIDEQINLESNDNNTDTEKYFDRISFINSKIEEKFPEIDESLLEKLSEDLYQALYE